MLIMNGDIIDMWQFKKRHWNIYHTKLIRLILTLINNGVTVHYITGNHDEELRRFKGFKISNFKISNKLILNLNGKKTWFFHGDVFDITMQHSKWLTKLGSCGYDLLILLNFIINKIYFISKKEKTSFSKKIKKNIKQAVKYINQFENTIVEIAENHGFASVVCGHIHEPCIKTFKLKNKNIEYLNSGDWVENLTSLEYNNGNWEIYKFNYSDFKTDESFKPINKIFNEMLDDYNILTK